MDATPAPPNKQRSPFQSGFFLSWCAALFFLGALGITAARISSKYQPPGVNSVENQGYCDFHNGVYYPAKAFLNRVSPYSVEYAESYPVHRPLPFLSPAALLVHAPLAILPLRPAEIIYFLISALLVIWISSFIVRSQSSVPTRSGEEGGLGLPATLGLAAFIVLSRGGQQTFFTGYLTFELIFASLLAIEWGHRRPILAGLALAVVSFKPNYVLPLGFLLLSQGKWKSVTIGGVISLVGAIAATAWIEPEQGLTGLWEDVQQSQEIHLAEDWEQPVNNWVRVDATALVSKWMKWNPSEPTQILWMFAFVLPATILIRKYHSLGTKKSQGIHSLTGALLLLVPLVSLYHQAYDALLALPVAVSAWISRDEEWQAISPGIRNVIATCCLLPAVNYLSSQLVIARLGLAGIPFQFVTSINALALLVATALLAWHLARKIVLPAESPSRS